MNLFLLEILAQNWFPNALIVVQHAMVGVEAPKPSTTSIALWIFQI